MKSKLFLATLLLFCCSFFANAQGGFQRRTVEERVKDAMEKTVPALTLADEQKPKVSDAFTDYYKEMDKLREGMSEGKRPERSEFEKVIEKRDEKLKELLTPDQFKKFKDEVEPTLRPQRRQNI